MSNVKRKKQRGIVLIFIYDRRLEFLAVKRAVTPVSGFPTCRSGSSKPWWWIIEADKRLPHTLRYRLSIEIILTSILLMLQLYGLSTAWGTVQYNSLHNFRHIFSVYIAPEVCCIFWKHSYNPFLARQSSQLPYLHILLS